MKLSNPVIYKATLSTMLAVCAFAFFAFVYPHHLHYHEDLQLFLFTKAYATDVIGVPGGIADYLSRFAVQFFYNSAVGSIIIALLLLVCQLTTWLLMPRRTIATYAMSLLPAMAMWAFLCDENAMPSATISLIFTQLSAWAIINIRSAVNKMALWIVSIPFLYFLFGPIALTISIIVAVDLLPATYPKSIKYGASALAIIIALSMPSIAHHWFPFPVESLRMGLHYMRSTTIFPTMAWVSAALVIVSQLLSLLYPKLPESVIQLKCNDKNITNKSGKNKSSKSSSSKNTSSKKMWRLTVATAVVVIVAGVYMIKDNTDMAKEDIFAYHYLAGQQKWDEIVKRSETNAPHSPITLIYTNLALAKTGVLNDRLMDMPQHDIAGLLPQFGDNFFEPFATAEVYYQIGMLKAAMQFSYEIQQSIPDAQMSARLTKRLAELNILNGNRDLARKYLKTLEHSIHYADWARERLKICDNSVSAKDSDEYAQLAQNSRMADIFFDENDPKAMLTQLVKDNPSNQIAYDYLIASYLLSRDIEPLPEVIRPGTTLPIALQQALALRWAHDNTSWQGLPWPLSDTVKNDFITFSRTYSEGMPASAIPQSMQNTYWAYYFNE